MGRKLKKATKNGRKVVVNVKKRRGVREVICLETNKKEKIKEKERKCAKAGKVRRLDCLWKEEKQVVGIEVVVEDARSVGFASKTCFLLRWSPTCRHCHRRRRRRRHRRCHLRRRRRRCRCHHRRPRRPRQRAPPCTPPTAWAEGLLTSQAGTHRAAKQQPEFFTSTFFKCFNLEMKKQKEEEEDFVAQLQKLNVVERDSNSWKNK